MANEMKHVTVGTELTQAEYESITAHAFNNQVAGDIMYASSATQLSKLGVTDSKILISSSSLPAWSSTLPAFTLGGTLTLNAQTLDAGSGSLSLTTSGSQKGLEITSTDAGTGAVLIQGYKNSASPVADDYIVQIKGIGKDTAGSAQSYGSWSVQIEDSTDTTECGKHIWHTWVNGTINTPMTLSSAGNLWLDAGLTLGSTATGINFNGTYTGNAIDFSSATIAPTGSNGPCFIRAGTYASPIDLGADTDQSGMIRLYSTTSATTSTGYDRGIFVCQQTTSTKRIHPIAGLAEVRNATGNGPTAVGAAQFISNLILDTSKVDARSAVGLANFYGGWFKVCSAVSSEAKSGSVVAPIWLDTQMNGTVNGEMYAAFITTGHHNDAVFGFEETGGGGHWDYLFSFDDTTYDQAPVFSAGTCKVDASKDSTGTLTINLNGTTYYIGYWAAADLTS